MSLINDALKKAQRERGAGNRPPTAEGTGATGANPPVSQTGSSVPRLDPRTRLVTIGGGAIALLAIAIAAVVWWPRAATPPGPPLATASPVATVVVAKLNPVVPTTNVAAPPAAPIALPVIVPVSAPKPAPPPEKPAIAEVQPSPSPAPTIATAPGPAAVSPPTPAKIAPANPVVAPAPPPAPALPQRNPQVENLIDGLHVTAIKPSATDPRAMWDDRVFKLGDVIDRASGLRLTKISASQLTFTDANGIEYDKKL